MATSVLQIEDAAVTETPQKDTSRWRVVALTSIVAFIIVAGTLATLLVLQMRAVVPPSDAPTSQAIASQLTDYGGREESGTLSPDGRSFAFVSDRGGTPDIWRRQVLGGEPFPLTDDGIAEADLAYSQDGERIYYTRAEASGESIWQIGVLGGQPQKWLPTDTRRPRRLMDAASRISSERRRAPPRRSW